MDREVSKSRSPLKAILFTAEESETKSKLDTKLNEYIDINLPKVVRGDTLGAGDCRSLFFLC